MKIQTKTDTFLKTLSLNNRVVSQNPSLPILSDVLIEAERNTVTLTTTDLELSIKSQIAVAVTESGAVAVPAKILQEYLSNIADDKLELSSEKETVTIISTGTKATISGNSAAEFPVVNKLPDKKILEFNPGEFHKIISTINVAAAVDPTRPVLSGISIKTIKDGLIFAATDGYRLAKRLVRQKSSEPVELIVPARSMTEVSRAFGEETDGKISMFVSKDENQVLFSGDGVQIYTRLIDGAYPDYEQIIPKEFQIAPLISKEELIKAIKLAAVFSRDIGSVIHLKFSKTGIEVSGITAQVGQGSSVVAASNVSKELTVAFNSKYLLDGLSVIEDEVVRMSISGPTSPSLLESRHGEEYKYIVMPVRTQS